MRVADYRDLMSGLADALASFRSAATPEESVKEAAIVRRRRDELAIADCKRASSDDQNKMMRLVAMADQEVGLVCVRCEKAFCPLEPNRKQCAACVRQSIADVNLTRLAAGLAPVC